VNDGKYIGLDVHQATIVVAVMDSTGKLVMESILETAAAMILQFFAGLRGTLSVTFEEGTWSAWLYDLLNPHVDKLVVLHSKPPQPGVNECNGDFTPATTWRIGSLVPATSRASRFTQ
jgi:hypothetical protein